MIHRVHRQLAHRVGSALLGSSLVFRSLGLGECVDRSLESSPGDRVQHAIDQIQAI